MKNLRNSLKKVVARSINSPKLFRKKKHNFKNKRETTTKK